MCGWSAGEQETCWTDTVYDVPNEWASKGITECFLMCPIGKVHPAKNVYKYGGRGTKMKEKMYKFYLPTINNSFKLMLFNFGTKVFKCHKTPHSAQEVVYYSVCTFILLAGCGCRQEPDRCLQGFTKCCGVYGCHIAYNHEHNHHSSV